MQISFRILLFTVIGIGFGFCNGILERNVRDGIREGKGRRFGRMKRTLKKFDSKLKGGIGDTCFYDYDCNDKFSFALPQEKDQPLQFIEGNLVCGPHQDHLLHCCIQFGFPCFNDSECCDNLVCQKDDHMREYMNKFNDLRLKKEKGKECLDLNEKIIKAFGGKVCTFS